MRLVRRREEVPSWDSSSCSCALVCFAFCWFLWVFFGFDLFDHGFENSAHASFKVSYSSVGLVSHFLSVSLSLCKEWLYSSLSTINQAFLLDKTLMTLYFSSPLLLWLHHHHHHSEIADNNKRSCNWKAVSSSSSSLCDWLQTTRSSFCN